MYAYVYEGHRHDTGDKLGFLKATVEFALKRSDLGGPFREYLAEFEAYNWRRTRGIRGASARLRLIEKV